MRIRWRGLELPSRVVRDDAVSTNAYGRFIIEPFEQGFGTTIGNSLRRVLLSCLEGAAVTSVKIEGVAHEFASIDGVLEDVTDIILNIKGIALRLDADEPRKMSVERTSAGEVRAGDLITDPAIQIANPEQLLATLTTDTTFRAEMTVQKGRGYVPGSDNRSSEQELGVIPIDAVFSPVARVRYRTENTRVGQRTNYDRLILEIWTDRTVTPEDTLAEAGLILRKHLNPIVMYHELTGETVTRTDRGFQLATAEHESTEDLLEQSVSALNLSVRARNCLEAAQIMTVGQLVRLTEADLLRVRSFGKTSLTEVKRRLEERGLSLRSEEEAGPAGGEPSGDNAESSEAEGGSGTQNASVSTSEGHMEAFTMDD